MAHETATHIPTSLVAARCLMLACVLEITEAYPQLQRGRQAVTAKPTADSTPHHSICNITVEQNSVLVNCSWKALESVPMLPTNSTTILLDHNQIKSIYNSTFKGMRYIQTIDLSYNPLAYISMDLFNGITSLRSVIIRDSELQRQQLIDFRDLFSDITSLDEFVMTFSYMPIVNYCASKYLPFTNTQDLAKVRRLEIDVSLLEGLHSSHSDIQMSHPLLSETSSMVRHAPLTTSLTIRDEGHVCLFKKLHSRHFSNFTSVETLLFFNYLSYTSIESDSFSSLHGLKELSMFDQSSICHDPDKDISMNFNYVLINVTTSVAKHENFTELAFIGANNFCSRYSLPHLTLSSNISVSQSLQSLTLQSLGLKLPNTARLENIPNSVKTLKIGGNCLVIYNTMYLTDNYPNIMVIDARNANSCHAFDYVSSHALDNMSSQALDYISHHKFDNAPKSMFHNDISKLQELYISQCVYACSDFYFQRHCPPNIKRFELSWSVGLEYLPYLNSFLKGCPGLEFLDLTGCKVASIDHDTFQGATLLNTLQLSHNRIGEIGHIGKFLNPLYKLQVLNLANNHITNLDELTFENLTELHELDLSGNYLTEISPSISQMKHLQLLNISHNNLNTLHSKTRYILNAFSRNGPVSIDITENPLLCICKTSDFINWMMSTRVKVLNLHSQTCLMSNGSKVSLGKLQTIADTLKATCVSNTVLYVACSASFALIISVVISAMVYRFRWRIRYLYYMAKLRVADKPPEYERIFEYDSFISYASEDSEIARKGCIENLEQRDGLKLFIHERDFEVGETIAYNISVGIHSSKRTILFVSESFLKSEWCLYEMNIARMETFYTKRKLLLIVILQSDVIQHVPIELLDLIRTKTYLEYPEHGNENDLMIFWNRLSSFIQGQ